MDHHDDFAQMAAQQVVRATACAVAASSSPGHADEALGHLFLLHGKQFASAVSISHYNNEPILKLIVPATGRFLFQVGPHYVLPPPAVYCSCSAFHFGMVSKQSSWGCKHILSVELALQQDARILGASRGSTAQGDDASPHSISSALEATPLALPRRVLPSAADLVSLMIREKTITEEEFVEIMAM